MITVTFKTFQDYPDESVLPLVDYWKNKQLQTVGYNPKIHIMCVNSFDKMMTTLRERYGTNFDFTRIIYGKEE